MRTDNKDYAGAGDSLVSRLDGKLAGYLAAGSGLALAVSSQSEAAIVGNTTVQPFGINGEVGIDFNGDGQLDFEIDHDRVDLGGGNIVDYLQLDKNDTNGASPGENLLPIDVFDTFDLNGTVANNTADMKYVLPTANASDYPAALSFGAPIGPGSLLDFQEGDNFAGSGKTIRANRLIDEDATQVDQVVGGLSAAQVQVPTNGPNFLGLAGETRYLGVQMNLNGAGINYGWIGVRIDNEADATGAVVGYAYETNVDQGIAAGQIPEPTTILTAAFGAVALLGGRALGRLRENFSKR